MPAEELGQRTAVAASGTADQFVIADVGPLSLIGPPHPLWAADWPAHPTASGPETLYGEA